MNMIKSFVYGAAFFVLASWGAAHDPDAPLSSSLSSPTPSSHLYSMKVEPDRLALSRVLCLDGGGVRGAYTAQVLGDFKKELDDERICDFFQGGITGTSTGAIIALAVVAPEHRNKITGEMEEGPYPAQEIVSFYEEMADEIFKCWTPANCWTNTTHGYNESWAESLKKTLWNMATCFCCCACFKNCNGFCGPKYSNHSLRAFLEKHFGDLTLKEALVPVQIVSYDISRNAPVYFNSYTHPNVKFVDAALCSSAAPTYFSGVSIEDGDNGPPYQCIDGGIFDNSACLAALRLGLVHWDKIPTRDPSFKPHMDNFVLLSIGTGERMIGSRYKNLKHAGKLTWASAAVEISIDGASQATHANLQAIYEATKGEDEIRRYFRIQTILPDTEAEMDNASIIQQLRGRAREDTSGGRPNEAFREFVRNHVRSPKTL